MIFILLPAFNEEQSIIPLINAIQLVADHHFIEPVKIIAIDDGSTDDTLEKLLQCEEDDLVVIQHGSNKGLGQAIKSGFTTVLSISNENDIIITMDADGTHSPVLIPSMVSSIKKGSDVVIASRYRRGSRTIGVQLYRQFYSIMMGIMFRLLFPIPGVRDYSSGYRAYRASVVKNAFIIFGDNFVNQSGFACTVDILIKLRKMELTFSEVPLVLRYDYKKGLSKMNINMTISSTLKIVFKEKFNNDRNKPLPTISKIYPPR